MANDDEAISPNYEAFRDSFFTNLVTATMAAESVKHTNKRRHKSATQSTSDSSLDEQGLPKSGDDPAELADFSDYIASEVFPSLPEDLRCLSYQALQEQSDLSDKWSLPLTLTVIEQVTENIPPSVSDSLTAYGLIAPPKSDIQSFIAPVISNYISSTTTPPPKWIATRVSACEICEREWIPLTYHHLIPRGVHAKVLKRGWHDEAMLNSVAWLCRACHSFVHRMASNEELAKTWYTVEKICEREDVQKWAAWISRVRWKKT